MRIIKKIILILVVLIGLFLLAALIMKKDYAVEREVVINKPKDSIFNYIKYVKNQDHFSVWNQKDPAMKKTSSGTDGQIGFVYGWDSAKEDVGAGEQEIKKITNGERIDFELRFTRPFESTDNAYFTTEAVSATQTKVKWGFNGKMPFPMNAMMPIMGMEDMLGKDLQKGLDDLKVLLEKQ
ncbi:Polyketide cyclase / dehydrase and lipid transport [Flavobacterium swingsii]|jgi:hypothetical protein|uniref:Polyketide cyclase / dehydrase and lipid transport n=1 Tax=Flavobacterium swingsii TaxID=498292 RepID=A0A1I0ZFY4_9FLAO|nr:SRPBCC family protein [Flavobacterium swingsii]SFB24307.1 Polyketide cyclase / dehydrase and lipid transport [Flavobacterium swingsii]